MQIVLYLISQRYKFESESQQPSNGDYNPDKLYLISQRYKFESESQLKPKNIKTLSAVFNKSKIQI